MNVATVLAALLILTGCLAAVYGALLFASIDSSDTDTADLVVHGAAFAVPGLAAVVAGSWLLRRRLRRR